MATFRRESEEKAVLFTFSGSRDFDSRGIAVCNSREYTIIDIELGLVFQSEKSNQAGQFICNCQCNKIYLFTQQYCVD